MLTTYKTYTFRPEDEKDELQPCWPSACLVIKPFFWTLPAVRLSHGCNVSHASCLQTNQKTVACSLTACKVNLLCQMSTYEAFVCLTKATRCLGCSVLYLGATNLQGAGCVRSCTTFSVLVKWTDKNILGECGALENPQNTHRDTHTHTPSDAHTSAPQLGLHNVSAHITIFHITTHTPVNISDDHRLLAHIDTPTITILVCFMPLLCWLSQILQYLCVQQYFNKEYQNWYVFFSPLHFGKLQLLMYI